MTRYVANPRWGEFRRTVHLRDGSTKLLVFKAGEPVDLGGEEIEALRKEIGLERILPEGATPTVVKPEPARLDPREDDPAAEVDILRRPLPSLRAWASRTFR